MVRFSKVRSLTATLSIALNQTQLGYGRRRYIVAAHLPFILSFSFLHFQHHFKYRAESSNSQRLHVTILWETMGRISSIVQATVRVSDFYLASRMCKTGTWSCRQLMYNSTPSADDAALTCLKMSARAPSAVHSYRLHHYTHAQSWRRQHFHIGRALTLVDSAFIVNMSQALILSNALPLSVAACTVPSRLFNLPLLSNNSRPNQHRLFLTF